MLIKPIQFQLASSQCYQKLTLSLTDPSPFLFHFPPNFSSSVKNDKVPRFYFSSVQSRKPTSMEKYFFMFLGNKEKKKSTELFRKMFFLSFHLLHLFAELFLPCVQLIQKERERNTFGSNIVRSLIRSHSKSISQTVNEVFCREMGEGTCQI